MRRSFLLASRTGAAVLLGQELIYKQFQRSARCPILQLIVWAYVQRAHGWRYKHGPNRQLMSNSIIYFGHVRYGVTACDKVLTKLCLKHVMQTSKVTDTTMLIRAWGGESPVGSCSRIVCIQGGSCNRNDVLQHTMKSLLSFNCFGLLVTSKQKQ